VTWLAPEQDGGSQVNSYLVMKREKENDSWTEVASGVARTTLKVSAMH